AVSCMDHQIELQAFSLFRPDTPYDFIVCTDTRRLQAAQSAHSYASKHPAPGYIALAPHGSIANANGLFYGLDYRMMAHKAAKALVAHLEQGAPLARQTLLPNNGFPAFPAGGARQAKELSLLSVASPSSEALMLLAPHLEKTQGIRLNLSIMSLDDIYSLVLSSGGATPYDLIRMDMAWIDELAALAYRPLEEIDHPWNRLFESFRPEFMQDYSEAGGVRYSLPYDPSTQLLFYRKDLLENPFFKRMYFEATRKELKIPETFEEYNQVARFFTQSLNPQAPTLYGTTVAIGNAMVGASEYYVRLLGMGGGPLDGAGRVALNTPQAMAALQNLMEAYQYSDKSQYQWWKSVLQGFAQGNAAMTVVFMNYAADILNLQQSSIAGKVGYAAVPGGRPLIGGGIIGISRTAKNVPAACAFLDWLYSPSIASAFTLLGGLSPCQSAYSNRDVYEKYPWLTAAKKSFPVAQRRHKSSAYINFSQHQLEKVLAFEVKNAVLGIVEPSEALARAQQSCEESFALQPPGKPLP
ncbi:MAG: ABC transporter substrate-binding protein, partial [Oscillospiraceae bacterium]